MFDLVVLTINIYSCAPCLLSSAFWNGSNSSSVIDQTFLHALNKISQYPLCTEIRWPLNWEGFQILNYFIC